MGRIIDVSYSDLDKLLSENNQETKESAELTKRSYEHNEFYRLNDNKQNLIKDTSYLDSRTDGLRVQYPHGVILQQAQRRYFFRGENQVYPNSQPSLQRKINTYSNDKDKALYRIVADMRIAEFSFFINKFEHVNNWKCSDVLYEILAQHYGLETNWLDVTTDFAAALFFATCYYDTAAHKWKPLTKQHIEGYNKKYGVLFRAKTNAMALRWNENIKIFEALPNKRPIALDIPNLVYPIGFQPFMRCHMQNGYGIYMRDALPLQNDNDFEILRFAHSEKLSNEIYELMDCGKKIYPHEGLNSAMSIINNISKLTVFSKNAFYYALKRSHEYSLSDANKCIEDLKHFMINGNPARIQYNTPIRINEETIRQVNSQYKNFDVEQTYNIKITERKIYHAGPNMFEPWMLSNNNNIVGDVDFKPREMVGCKNLWTNGLVQIQSAFLAAYNDEDLDLYI